MSTMHGQFANKRRIMLHTRKNTGYKNRKQEDSSGEFSHTGGWHLPAVGREKRYSNASFELVGSSAKTVGLDSLLAVSVWPSARCASTELPKSANGLLADV